MSALIACAWVLAMSPPAAVWAEMANRIAAIVNDEIITDGDVAIALADFLQQHDPGTISESELPAARAAVLQRLIEERLIIQEAKRLKLSVSPGDVLKELAEIQSRFDTPVAYEQMLQEQGISEESLKQQLRDHLLAQKVIEQEVRSTIAVSPAELAQIATSSSANPGEEVFVHHLLIRVTEQRSAGEAEGLAGRLYEQLLQGASFEELARRRSEDPHAQEGGVLGWVQRGQLLPELDEVLFRLKPGELSSPVRTRLGFHLVKLVERRHLSSAHLVEASKRREQKIYHEKFSRALDEWVEGLRKRAYIQILESTR